MEARPSANATGWSGQGCCDVLAIISDWFAACDLLFNHVTEATIEINGKIIHDPDASSFSSMHPAVQMLSNY